jgi:hypothetical protein
MADKLLIAITAQGAVLGDWRGGRIVECRNYAHDDDGLAGFKEHLTQFTDVPVYVLVDAVEEDYRFETLPHATGRDRADMVGRKLKQHYRNTPYLSAWLLGRDSDKRRDDRYMFSALTNPDLIGDWLQAVAARGLPIAGLYLLPMVISDLLDRFDAKAANLLLVAQHANGLRLTFFRNRQFRLSRLTRGDSGRAENRTRYLSEEISNTRLYLHALRTMTLDEQLTVLLVDRGDELAEAAAGIVRENPSLECVRLSRQELAGRLGIADSLLAISPYAIYLHLLGLKEPPGNLAPASITTGYQRYRMRRMIYAACGAVAAGAVIWTGVNFYQALTLRWDAEDAERQSARLAAQYQEVTRQFPQAPASADNLRKAVEIAQQLRQSSHDPQGVMTLLSRAMEVSPAIVIKAIGWKYGASEIETETGARASTGERPAAPTVSTSAIGPAPRRESALIEGEIRPFRGDYRSAIVTINGFASRLAEEPDVAEVRVVKLPLNVSPALSLSGNTLDNAEQSGNATAEFKLLVILKPNA